MKNTKKRIKNKARIITATELLVQKLFPVIFPIFSVIIVQFCVSFFLFKSGFLLHSFQSIQNLCCFPFIHLDHGWHTQFGIQPHIFSVWGLFFSVPQWFISVHVLVWTPFLHSDHFPQAQFSIHTWLFWLLFCSIELLSWLFWLSCVFWLLEFWLFWFFTCKRWVF